MVHHNILWNITRAYIRNENNMGFSAIISRLLFSSQSTILCNANECYMAGPCSCNIIERMNTMNAILWLWGKFPQQFSMQTFEYMQFECGIANKFVWGTIFVIWSIELCIIQLNCGMNLFFWPCVRSVCCGCRWFSLMSPNLSSLSISTLGEKSQ